MDSAAILAKVVKYRSGKPRKSPSFAGKGKGVTWLRERVGWTGDECLIWPFSRNSVSGHGYVGFKNKNLLAHRFMCELVNGPPPTPQHQTAHECGRAHLGCVNPKHLSWKTPGENERDKHRHGTTGKGEPRFKLTADQVADIRASAAKVPALAAQYGVTESNIRQILRRKTWRTGEYSPGGFAAKPYHRNR